MIDGRRIVAGWLLALAASAVIPAWSVARKIAENPLGRYVAQDGSWTADVYVRFFWAWLPIATGVSLLALACLFLDRRRD